MPSGEAGGIFYNPVVAVLGVIVLILLVIILSFLIICICCVCRKKNRIEILTASVVNPGGTSKYAWLPARKEKMNENDYMHL